ncbi:MAG: acyl-CoA thioesterase II [Bacteroidota bacterium]
MANEKSLVELLDLEQIEVNLFRGDSRDIGSMNVFGGQVLGQALNAAIRTVESERFVHSLHAYFLLPGDMKAPILYEVDRIRDGRSFVTRRVVAIQHGKAIFNLAASFQKVEEGPTHHSQMPQVPGPEGLPTMNDLRKEIGQQLPPRFARFFNQEWPIEVRPIDEVNPLKPEKREPRKHVWMRANESLPADIDFHKCVLAYASDFNLLSTALLPHAISYMTPGLQAASLDHAMWFHRPFKADQWLLYTMESPNMSNARGLGIGEIYTQEGELVATVAQEGLLRLRKG